MNTIIFISQMKELRIGVVKEHLQIGTGGPEGGLSILHVCALQNNAIIYCFPISKVPCLQKLSVSNFIVKVTVNTNCILMFIPPFIFHYSCHLSLQKNKYTLHKWMLVLQRLIVCDYEFFQCLLEGSPKARQSIVRGRLKTTPQFRIHRISERAGLKRKPEEQKESQSKSQRPGKTRTKEIK